MNRLINLPEDIVDKIYAMKHKLETYDTNNEFWEHHNTYKFNLRSNRFDKVMKHCNKIWAQNFNADNNGLNNIISMLEKEQISIDEMSRISCEIHQEEMRYMVRYFIECGYGYYDEYHDWLKQNL